jgi:DNA-binding transcriptional LysR family regulator
MNREDWPDLAVFAAVAEARSFTRAARSLGMSTSAVSHTLKALEARLGVRLLSRTTRNVAPTEAGERLLDALRPAMGEIVRAVDDLGVFRDRPAGRLRLTVHRGAAMRQLAPRLPAFALAYPDVDLEVAIEDGLTDLVEHRFDAGVRYGELVARDMISVRIGPDERAAVVATPAYFETHPPPRTPHEIGLHRCLAYRHVTTGALGRWELERDDQVANIVVEPCFVTNDGDLLLEAALGGMGLAYLLEVQVVPHLASGRLVRVLDDWCPPFPGSFLYYPSRRHVTPALRALIDALRVDAR